MTNSDILRIAMEQSAVDLGCCAEDFEQNESKVVISAKNPGARRYLNLPFICNLVTYGKNIVASVSEQCAPCVRRFIDKFSPERCFETPNLLVLDDEMRAFGARVCFMAEYFLPDLSSLKPVECGYELRILESSDFAELYTPEWGNALCEDRKELDVLGVGAYDGDKLVGLAACSADCETMWQIGVDVLPEYRRRGIAAAATSALAIEILRRGKVPFYCCAWSNIKSARNAIKCGFRPAWVELTVKSEQFVKEMNKQNADA